MGEGKHIHAPLTGLTIFPTFSSNFPPVLYFLEERVLSEISTRDKILLHASSLGSPVFTNRQPCEQACPRSPEQVTFLSTETGKGGYYFSWERSRALGWDWLIQTRWVATHRCDKNRNTLQTFQALSSPGQEVGRLRCWLIYLLMCFPIKEC